MPIDSSINIILILRTLTVPPETNSLCLCRCLYQSQSLSLFLFLSLCASLSLFVSVSISLCLCLSFCLCLSVPLSVSVCLCLCLCLGLCQIWMFNIPQQDMLKKQKIQSYKTLLIDPHCETLLPYWLWCSTRNNAWTIIISLTHEWPHHTQDYLQIIACYTIQSNQSKAKSFFNKTLMNYKYWLTNGVMPQNIKSNASKYQFMRIHRFPKPLEIFYN